jgi:hypothetical protein
MRYNCWPYFSTVVIPIPEMASSSRAVPEWLGSLTKTRWRYSGRHCDGNRSIEQRGHRGRWHWSMLERFPLIRACASRLAQTSTRARSPLIGVLAGLLITALVQSSSITIGLAILLVQQGMLAAAGAIPIVIGAKYRDDLDRLGRKPQDEADGASNGNRESRVQRVWRPVIPALSRLVLKCRG